MKLFLFLNYFFAMALVGISQNTQKQTAKFTAANRFYNDTVCGQSWSWTINRKKLKSVKGGMEIGIHFPLIDTVVATNKATKEKRTILTRFNPGLNYILEAQSCDNAMDIYNPETVKATNAMYDSIDKLPEKKKERAWNYADSLWRKKESPIVVFKLLNAERTDTLCGTFGDIHIGFTKGCLLKARLQDTISEPFYLESSGSCYQVFVARASRTGKLSDDPYKQRPYFSLGNFTGPIYFLSEEFFASYFRFFNKEKILVTYDLKKKKTKVEVID